jgi:hypothetical protein
VNPKFHADAGRDKPGLVDFCGAGLVFLFCDAFAPRWPCAGWDQTRATVLAGLATCADVVPVLGINRALRKLAVGYAADEQVRGAKLPGLDALHRVIHGRELEDGQPLPEVDEETFGFEWAPGINACGRLDEARVPVELLLSRTAAQALPRAQWCFDMNQRRIRMQRRILPCCIGGGGVFTARRLGPSEAPWPSSSAFVPHLCRPCSVRQRLPTKAEDEGAGSPARGACATGLAPRGARQGPWLAAPVAAPPAC